MTDRNEARLLAATRLLSRRGLSRPDVDDVITEIRSDGIIKFKDDPAPTQPIPYAPLGIMIILWKYTLPWRDANDLRQWLGKKVVDGAGNTVANTVEEWLFSVDQAIGVKYGGTFVSVGTPQAEISTYWWFRGVQALTKLSTALQASQSAQGAPQQMGGGVPNPKDDVLEVFRQFRHWVEMDPNRHETRLELLSKFGDLSTEWDVAPMIAVGLRL
ncbi:MAG TPA: hypothetical protein VF342_00080 [Alphaproteobacteria bacterium]